MKIKVVYSGEIRRWPVPSNNVFGCLVKYLCFNFDFNSQRDFVIQFEDDEGDNVTITNGIELKEAMELADSCNRKSLKLFVSRRKESFVSQRNKMKRKDRRPARRSVYPRAVQASRRKPMKKPFNAPRRPLWMNPRFKMNEEFCRAVNNHQKRVLRPWKRRPVVAAAAPKAAPPAAVAPPAAAARLEALTCFCGGLLSETTVKAARVHLMEHNKCGSCERVCKAHEKIHRCDRGCHQLHSKGYRLCVDCSSFQIQMARSLADKTAHNKAAAVEAAAAAVVVSEVKNDPEDMDLVEIEDIVEIRVPEKKDNFPFLRQLQFIKEMGLLPQDEETIRFLLIKHQGDAQKVVEQIMGL